MTPKLWLSPKEAAEILGVSHNTLYKMLRRGEIPSRRLGPRMYRIPASAVLPPGMTAPGLDGGGDEGDPK